MGAGSGLGWMLARAACARRPLACPLAQGRAAQDKGAGGSCPDRRAGAASATRSARRLRGLAGEARRPPLSAPPRRAGSAGSARHRAAGAGHCSPGGAARPSRGQNPQAWPEPSRGRRCHRDSDRFRGSGAFYELRCASGKRIALLIKASEVRPTEKVEGGHTRLRRMSKKNPVRSRTLVSMVACVCVEQL